MKTPTRWFEGTTPPARWSGKALHRLRRVRELSAPLWGSFVVDDRDPQGLNGVVDDNGHENGIPRRTRHRNVEDVIGDCAVYETGLRSSTRLPMQQAAQAARRTNGFVWIGLQNPSAEDVQHVAGEFRLPPLAVEDAINALQRPKLEVYEDEKVSFMVLRPVRYVDSEEIVEVEEIALFVGEHFLVSVRHGQTDVLSRVRRELDAGRLEASERGPIAVLHRVADLIVDEYEVVAASIDDDIGQIEQQVFGLREGDHTERIYKLKREVLEFRRAVLPLGEPMFKLMTGGVPGSDKSARKYFRDVHDHIMRVTDEIERQDSLLSDVLQANVARLSVTQNEVAMRQNNDMRKISAWAAIGLVPTAIAGVYGMNFEHMPELGWKYGYAYALTLIVSISVGLWALFKRNDWL
ncbi:magnesium and cobalt transport protein CorA [Kineosporia rhizophila]|uniref:magnesium and cobalt transport protein CorA n=1 Tax=Kineosporia TaxID=49184 RepID=UPI001E3DA116|nr:MULTISPECIES: magnesium and cobalt transport protein CorA [Kineosporia]MCE0539471.1 magnesium and cobalt transport protein CorA [Kineosporia rhizophila]GLY18472.1 magnesium transport protein CorA [Kineosporia sp. NBRC 101677]